MYIETTPHEVLLMPFSFVGEHPNRRECGLWSFPRQTLECEKDEEEGTDTCNNYYDKDGGHANEG